MFKKDLGSILIRLQELLLGRIAWW